ncbi:hypothetical protein OSB04_020073 [Centaurea solstitialis]|uniref:Uncharacterized protein n=1 Tax=Centaurea solstitialis TaxID=347529 RepID=A0AA38SRI9_9ASTR|nr:hypothetical protein OSB04_020073 [Centaurea solstitialis]
MQLMKPGPETGSSGYPAGNGSKITRTETSLDRFPILGTGTNHIGMTSHNRQYWNCSPNEESKLVDALVNLTNTGTFKADNGFKSGYLQHLEEALKVSLPSSGLLGTPHISSKIKTMKKRLTMCV